jgi:hypothetical protein
MEPFPLAGRYNQPEPVSFGPEIKEKFLGQVGLLGRQVLANSHADWTIDGNEVVDGVVRARKTTSEDESVLSLHLTYDRDAMQRGFRPSQHEQVAACVTQVSTENASSVVQSLDVRGDGRVCYSRHDDDGGSIQGLNSVTPGNVCLAALDMLDQLELDGPEGNNYYVVAGDNLPSNAGQ